MEADRIRMHVREHYARRAGGGCGGADLVEACCAAPEAAALEDVAGPALGCGSPLAHAGIQAGEVVVDLGAGAGREVLLAARQAGPGGRAIGVDMTPEMVWTARENARRAGIANAEFHLGEIERLPLPDASADAVISNCVINLVPDKAAAFREAYRILKPGGRLVVADIVSRGPLPEAIRQRPGAWAACIAGAMDVTDYLAAISAAGFVDVEEVTAAPAPPGKVFSVTVRARKPAG